ncbi:MAG: histidinol phosphatase, partial [Microcoleus sp. C1-bin4]|nr:histidinol phosphatase [Microcoleus sp. C1-bin4]
MQAVFLTLVWIVCYWFCLPVYAIGEPPIINLPKSTIESAIDFHIHSSPDVIPRKLDDFEVEKLAASAKMKAVVLKNHYASTA